MAKVCFKAVLWEAVSQSAPVQAPGCPSVRLASPAGHSRGAAVATLLAPWAALQWPSADVRCVTFGSPRVGNQAFVNVSSESCCTMTSQQAGNCHGIPSAAGPGEADVVRKQCPPPDFVSACRLLLSLWALSAEWSTRMTSSHQCPPLQVGPGSTSTC